LYNENIEFSLPFFNIFLKLYIINADAVDWYDFLQQRFS